MPRGKSEFSTMPTFSMEGQLRFSPVVNASNQEIVDIADMNPARSMSPGVIDLGDVSDVHVAKALDFDSEVVFKELDNSLTIEKTMFAKPQVKQGLMGKQAMAQGPRPKAISPKLTVNQPKSPKPTTAPAVMKPAKASPVRGQNNPSIKELPEGMIVTKAMLPLGEVIEPIYAAAHRMGKNTVRRNIRGEIKNQVGISNKPEEPSKPPTMKRGSAEFMVAKGFDVELVEKMANPIKALASRVRNWRGAARNPTGPRPKVFSNAYSQPAKARLNQGAIRKAEEAGDVISTPRVHNSGGEIPKTQIPTKTPTEAAKMETTTVTQQPTQPNVQSETPQKHHWSTLTKVGLGALGLGGAYGAYRVAKPAEPDYEDYYRQASYNGRTVAKGIGTPEKPESLANRVITYGNSLGVVPAVGLGVVAGDIANRIQDRRIQRGFSKVGNFLKKLKK